MQFYGIVLGVVYLLPHVKFRGYVRIAAVGLGDIFDLSIGINFSAFCVCNETIFEPVNIFII